MLSATAAGNRVSLTADRWVTTSFRACRSPVISGKGSAVNETYRPGAIQTVAASDTTRIEVC